MAAPDRKSPEKIDVEKIKYYAAAKKLSMEVDKYRAILINDRQHKLTERMITEFITEMASGLLELAGSLQEIVRLEGEK